MSLDVSPWKGSQQIQGFIMLGILSKKAAQEVTIVCWKHIVPGDMIVSRHNSSMYLCLSKVPSFDRHVRFTWYMLGFGFIEGANTDGEEELSHFMLVHDGDVVNSAPDTG